MKTYTLEHKGIAQTLEFNESFDASKLTTVLVVGPGYYGYGPSIAVARQRCIAAGCPRKAKMTAFMGDDSLGVNDFGQVSSALALINLGEV